ncbi:hypothetical protein WICANDRAFT_77827 [Wickerhamomyces anomalus NRRL Y-366-8]|uniref:Transcription initiation factor TFIID subunit 4 n=1 Tax=Wickerhamomyces anomalus (strain ATCC 58044 / CBS 1984 / NCYC 433 / NRRL Y-366-8) TaxID=683960 RepID=A0A1E3P7C9_WICAA|nr:uncharacterized protein WICANDRAFT_77827 [Wickerhamomyces anomalus NRRL Y-366-8]ODQ61180.1 hypothetical protein WICANDRAFT_77827 [Wickerhamomyces anomalus NRRL Y-366-8]
MSETPSQSTTSPQKRSNDDTQLNDSKRPKTSVEASTDLESFDINDFDLPQSTGAEASSPFKVDIPLVATTASSQPSASTSVIDIQNQFNLDLPDLPGESPSTTNIGRSPSVPQQTISQNDNNNNNNNAAANKNNKDTDENGLQKPSGTAEDPDKLSDALLSAGVDLKAEEALLTSTVNSLPTKQNGEQTAANAVQQPIIINTPFLDPRQVATFMSKVANANGIKQSFDNEVHSPILQLMTNACEEWMTNIVTNAVILSRHRRRSIRQRKRSEISKALREVAVQQKSQEDKRQQKRKNLGIDQEEQSKLGTEETQHKATNATVAMMTAGKKKKYSWMTGGGAGSGGSKASSGSVDGGIRFREAREEPGIAVRDLLSSLEKKRHGVEKVITKGYSKLKD